MSDVTDPYRVLGVRRAATLADIKSAHRRLAKAHHPDAGGDRARFLAVQAAYQVLSDPDQRRRWDTAHAPGPVAPGDSYEPRRTAGPGRRPDGSARATRGPAATSRSGAQGGRTACGMARPARKRARPIPDELDVVGGRRPVVGGRSAATDDRGGRHGCRTARYGCGGRRPGGQAGEAPRTRRAARSAGPSPGGRGKRRDFARTSVGRGCAGRRQQQRRPRRRRWLRPRRSRSRAGRSRHRRLFPVERCGMVRGVAGILPKGRGGHPARSAHGPQQLDRPHGVGAVRGGDRAGGRPAHRAPPGPPLPPSGRASVDPSSC